MNRRWIQVALGGFFLAALVTADMLETEMLETPAGKVAYTLQGEGCPLVLVGGATGHSTKQRLELGLGADGDGNGNLRLVAQESGRIKAPPGHSIAAVAPLAFKNGTHIAVGRGANRALTRTRLNEGG